MSKIRLRNYNYDPVLFLRCHAKSDRDMADVKTQVWQASFEPKKKSKLVATCGGNKICLIDIKSTEVEQRYTADTKEILYALAWSIVSSEFLTDSITILAAGGVQNIIYFVLPAQKITLTRFSLPKTGSKTHITNLLFHPQNSNLLFCSNSSGTIYLLQLEVDRETMLQVKVIQELNAGGEIFAVTFCRYSNLLLVATESGLVGFTATMDENNKWADTDPIKFRLPKNPSMNTDSDGFDLVDSVEALKHGFIAIKCALHGYIYLCDLNKAVKTETDTLFDLNPDYQLNWSSTDNYYMSVSVNLEKGLLTCGDDKGCIWIYDISEVKSSDKSAAKILQPVSKLVWPIVEDRYIAKSRKLDLDTYDIVVARAAIHRKGKYIVSVTNNNTVGIWKLASKK